MCDKNIQESLSAKTIEQHAKAAVAIRNVNDLPSLASPDEIDVEKAKAWVETHAL
ncbi:MAG TPA: hypothetical protein VFC84_19185 [Desulfosporosinus sp.]|nr:hypothetical protein [Desulfosporosinus sp.]